MGRLKNITCSVGSRQEEKLQFTYTVNVDQSGLFTTTIPAEVVEKFNDAGISLPHNRLNNAGFFSAGNLKDLERAVNEKAAELVSKELTSERIVLLYKIETACSYAMNEEGEIFPNAGYDYFPGEKYTRDKWRKGTKDTHATQHEPYGIGVVVEPKIRRDYIFKSGREVSQYERLEEPTDNLKWLVDLTGMGYDRFSSRPDQMDQIDYSEEVGLFFVNLIKSICLMNEQIKDHLDPESIKLMAHQGMALLGTGTPEGSE